MCASLVQSPLIAPLGALHGLAQLLACVDPQKWDSLARPAARDLATVLFAIHADLASAAELPEVTAA